MAKGAGLTRGQALAKARAFVKAHGAVIERVAIVGSILRNHDVVHDVDLLVVLKPGAELQSAPPVNVFTTTREAWEVAVLQYAPGLVTIGLRAKAKAAGFKLNHVGLWRGDELVSQCAAKICALVKAPVPAPVERSLSGELVLVGKEPR